MADLVTSKVLVDKYRPFVYAGASYDFNLIHIDPQVGKLAGLGGNVLQGMCTLGFAAKHLLKNHDPGELKSIKVRFAHPVRPLDTLTISSKEDDTGATFKVTNQDGMDAIVNGEATFR